MAAVAGFWGEMMRRLRLSTLATGVCVLVLFLIAACYYRTDVGENDLLVTSSLFYRRLWHWTGVPSVTGIVARDVLNWFPCAFKFPVLQNKCFAIEICLETEIYFHFIDSVQGKTFNSIHLRYFWCITATISAQFEKVNDRIEILSFSWSPVRGGADKRLR